MICVWHLNSSYLCLNISFAIYIYIYVKLRQKKNKINTNILLKKTLDSLHVQCKIYFQLVDRSLLNYWKLYVYNSALAYIGVCSDIMPIRQFKMSHNQWYLVSYPLNNLVWPKTHTEIFPKVIEIRLFFLLLIQY